MELRPVMVETTLVPPYRGFAGQKTNLLFPLDDCHLGEVEVQPAGVVGKCPGNEVPGADVRNEERAGQEAHAAIRATLPRLAAIVVLQCNRVGGTLSDLY